MADREYERPNRGNVEAAREIEYENPRPPIVEPERKKSLTDYGKEGAIVLGAGAGMGASAYALRAILRKALPGIMPKTSMLKDLDAAIRKSDRTSSLPTMMSNYMREVSGTDKPMTFADYLAQQPGHANAASVVKHWIPESGNVPGIEEMLAGRSAESKKRVLDDIAGALGVNPQSVVTGKDALIKSRKDKAEPLYTTAFADKRPITDSRLYALFEAPAARKALSEAVRNAENELVPIEVRSAASPRRKDWWKRMSTKDIPEGLFLDEEGANGLRRYIAPNLQNADAIQRSLYEQMKAAMVKDPVTGYDKHTNTSRSLDTLHKKFTKAMYDTAPNDDYRTARNIYSDDSKLIEAHKVGAELMKMNPAEARKAIKDMTPDQREMVASGFYGSMADMNQQKFMRELVARPERYPERREVLSAVFRDPNKLDQFLANLRGEEAMSDSAAAYGSPAPSKDAGPRLPWLRVTEPLLGGTTGAKMNLMSYLHPDKLDPFGLRSGKVARAGTEFAFREPTFFPRSVGHPDWADVTGTDLTAGSVAKRAAQWSGFGGAGGLSTYGASQIPLGRQQQPEPSPDLQAP